MMWSVAERCQVSESFVIAVAGVAGSGKTTLGRALASAFRAPLLDLDAITNPLLDRIPGSTLQGHWLSSPHRGAIREGRYAALREVARDVVGTAGAAVLVAPFTAELTGGPEWRALCDAVGPSSVDLIQIIGDPKLFALRRAARGEARDDYRPADHASPQPAVPVIPIDARLPTEQQVERVRQLLGR